MGRLSLQSVVKIINDETLRKFRRGPGGVFDLNPARAHAMNGDTFLFHGSADSNIANIQSTGLLMSFASNGMLGQGLYGAPDPQKSKNYCQKGNQTGNFMLICRFNLAGAQHAGPNTAHRNTHFDEYCVYDESRVVVLWLLKCA